MTIKFVEPDYEVHHERYGGHVEDMHKPYIFFFDKAKRPRVIKVHIMTYAGCIGSGGHYYVSIKEEENLIWANDGHDWCWTRPWKYNKIKGIEGRQWDGRFDNINVALKEIDKVLKSWKVSNKKKYKIVWNNEDLYAEKSVDDYRKKFNKLLKDD
jgi:hypothetical protein